MNCWNCLEIWSTKIVELNSFSFRTEFYAQSFMNSFNLRERRVKFCITLMRLSKKKNVLLEKKGWKSSWNIFYSIWHLVVYGTVPIWLFWYIRCFGVRVFFWLHQSAFSSSRYIREIIWVHKWCGITNRKTLWLSVCLWDFNKKKVLNHSTRLQTLQSTDLEVHTIWTRCDGNSTHIKKLEMRSFKFTPNFGVQNHTQN